MRPRQERPSPPVLPDRTRTGQNQRVSFRGTMCSASWGERGRIRTCPAAASRPAEDNTVSTEHSIHGCPGCRDLPSNLDRHGSSVLVPKIGLDTNLLHHALPRLSGLLWSTLYLALCPCTEITRWYLTGEARLGACWLCYVEDAC